MFAELEEHLTSKNALILGIGDRACGDNGIGSYLAKRLQGRLAIPVIDAGTLPEKSLAAIESSGADLALIVEAADFGASPGEISIFELDHLKELGVLTLTAHLPLLLNVIPKQKRPRGLLIAVQPAAVSGRTLSAEGRNALDGLEHIFLQLFKK
jgi:hydrogenase maturation protease